MIDPSLFPFPADPIRSSAASFDRLAQAYRLQAQQSSCDIGGLGHQGIIARGRVAMPPRSRGAMMQGGQRRCCALPTVNIAIEDRWWARREACAFAHCF
jgi:hypothetical protein